MARYDPLREPDPDDWLAHDEDERTALVEAYHGERGIEVPNLHLHARFHAVVETRLAEGDAVTRETLDRLQREGLDRHEAVHAIAYVVSTQVYGVRQRAPAKDAEADLAAKLRRISASRWRRT